MSIVDGWIVFSEIKRRRSRSRSSGNFRLWSCHMVECCGFSKNAVGISFDIQYVGMGKISPGVEIVLRQPLR